MQVILNGAYMSNRQQAHLYLKWKLRAPQYYGRNLDALWDVLSTYSQPLSIRLVNREQLMVHLGDYGEAIINTLQEAAQENRNICFAIEDEGV